MIVTGASVTGAAHVAAGRGCEDAFRAVDTECGGVVLAVADGMGSRERAALGARLAVDIACRVLSAGLPDRAAGPEQWTGWTADRGARTVETFLRAARAVEDAVAPPGGGEPAGTGDPAGGGASAGSKGPGGGGASAGSTGPAGVEQWAAALAVAVVRPPWVAFLSAGDCFGAVLTREAGAAERCHLVLPPPRPDGPPPAFLTSPGARLRLRTFAVWETELTGVVLATDGCAPAALDHPSSRGLPDEVGPLPSASFFPPLAETLRRGDGDAAALRALLSGPAAARTGDDLTVLCALTAAEGDGPWW
ncbi:protein phosphatase 2C domain-containing protein [Streptomyces sp. NPDC008121]|uniref:protein phosphatase 2C domain-containing protein n=1 Tax=Streptomyces sp. NPDC008121 TaxID=3364809 RepID=UPI0036E454D3